MQPENYNIFFCDDIISVIPLCSVYVIIFLVVTSDINTKKKNILFINKQKQSLEKIMLLSFHRRKLLMYEHLENLLRTQIAEIGHVKQLLFLFCKSCAFLIYFRHTQHMDRIQRSEILYFKVLIYYTYILYQRCNP